MDDAVEQLLHVPPSAVSRPQGYCRAVISDQDIIPKVAEIRALRQLAKAGRVDEALALAEAHLTGEQRNETLRRLAMGIVTDSTLADPSIEALERRLPREKMPVVQAALYLTACLHRRQPAKLALVSPLLWTAAVRWLFDYLDARALKAISAAIATKYPEQRFVARLHGAASLVPPALKGDRFFDRLDACAQLARAAHDEPAGLLVCFCGFHGRMGIPLNFLHRWAARERFHVLYLRDLQQSYFRQGVPVFGNTMDETTAAIRRLATELDVANLAVYGSSMGGLVAIRAGQALGAQRILSAAGTADISAETAGRELTPTEKVDVTREETSRLADDLRKNGVPRTTYLYGEAHERDAVAARMLAGVDNVDVVTLEDLNRHNIDFHLVMTGRYERVFAWLAGQRERIDLNA